MRYEDASQTGSMTSNVNAQDDTDHLAGNDFGPAIGNLITGSGTVSGATGTDMVGEGGHITAIVGAGGSDDSFDASGKLEVAGQYGTLTIDAEGNYTYVRNPGSPEGVSDTFTYTLADNAGGSDSAKLVIAIGNPPILQAEGTQTIQTNNGVVVLPAGVELSDVRVVGRDLVVTLPDGSTMVIPDGAIFVPQLVVNGVEVPASNLAALLIDSEPKPAAGDASPTQLSSGGNFEVPVQPLDPGVPLGDLIPPTELDYTPPEDRDIFPDEVDEEPVAGAVSVQLDDDVIPGKGGNSGGQGDNPPDTVGQNVASGALPGSGGDGNLTWAFLDSGEPSADFTYTVNPDGSLTVTQQQDGNPVVVLTVTLNESTGAFEATQVNPIRHESGGQENNAVFTINYTVTDEDGDVAGGTLTIDVDDDTPVVTVTAGSDSEVILTTDDEDTIGDSSDTDSSSANFSGVFSGTSVSPGADGAGPGTIHDYSLAVTSSSSGLTSHGNAINLYMVGDTVVGAVGSLPADLTDPDIVFTVEVAGDGTVTLTQLQQIDHAAETPSDAPFSDQFTTMVDGLVTLTRSETVVDKDGDSVTGSATVNIGANLHFTDDGPTVEGAQGASSVTLDETAGAEPLSAGDPIVVSSADPMIVGVGVDYGADGQGGDPVYGLSLLGGVDTLASGLATADGDHAITLELTSSTLITGTYNGGADTAFTIQMNSDGTVTVTQYTALEHLIDGSTPADHDDSLSLVTLIDEQAVSLINATVTYEDFDHDTATAEAPIGGAITFKDDGPSISIDVGSDENILLVTDDDGTEGPNSTSDSTTADFSGAFTLSSNGGGDGTASVSDISYHLSTAGGASGLTSHGSAINLYMVGTTVVGAIGSQPADLNDADIVFTVAVNGDGVVTLTQLQQIDHPAVDDPDGTDAPFADHVISMTDDSLIQLHATATITDNDGDTATADDAVLDIAANLVFRDDGPTIDASLKEGASVHVDESLPGTDNPGETDAEGLGQATVAISSLVDVTEDPVSADQPTTYEYSLVLGAAVGGLVDSGMMTSDGNHPVYLYLQLDGSVIGSTATDSGDVDGSNTVFTVEISGGNVVLTQYQAIEHGDAPSNYDENTLGLAANALQLQVTATDYDGDTDADSVDLGSVITFGDDGPTVTVVEGQIPTDPEALAGFQLTTQDHGTEAEGFTTDSTTVNFSDLFSLSKDGGSDGEASSSLTYDLDLLGAGNGPVDSGLDSHGQTIWLYQVDSNTIIGSTSGTAVALGDPSIVFQLVTTNDGAVTQTQFQQIDHPAITDPDGTDAPFADHIVSLGGNLINLVVTGTITDNDGDVATDPETLDLGGLVRFQDDGPTADNEGNLATVNDSASGVVIGNISTLLNGDNYHADGPAASNALTIATGSLGGTITIDPDGTMHYTSNHDTAPGDTDVETFTYTITDFDGDTASATFTVTLQESGPTIGETAISVDEEGLTNGIPGTAYGDGSDLAGEAKTASGTLTGLDFGGDGEGDIVLAASSDTGLRTLSNHVVATVWDGATHTLTGFDDANGDGIRQGGETAVFTLQITDVSTGAYTFTLLQPVKHTVANSEDDKSFSVDVTVTDFDTDPATGSINITIDDDSPQVSNVLGGGSVTLDETTAVTPAGFPISGSSLTAVISATTAFGADGAAAANATVYGLTLAGGVNSIASGLATAIGDFPITLNLVDSTHITGTYVNGGTQTAFTITMNANGTITVQQNVPLEHLIDGSSAAQHDDSLDLVLDGGALTNLVNATITITDADGDTHSGSTGIGDQIVFKDDGPTIDVTATNEASVLLTTQDADTILAATDTDTSTADFDDVFALAFTTGADGAATPDIAYDLSVLSGVSGLSSHGVAINLYELANGVIVGSTAGVAPALETDASVVFSVAVSADGTVTLKQYQQVDHAVEGTTTSPFDDQFAILANGKIQLSGSSTITDNDGDTATDTVNIDLGGNLRFADDGPAISATAASISVDEEGLTGGIAGTTYGDGSDLAGTSTTQSGTLSGISFGADGAGNVTLAAVADTGLRTLSNAVVKSAWDNTTHTLTGFVDTNGNGSVDVGETKVFTLEITNVSTGAYTFTLLQPVKHATADTEDNATFNIGVTVTDFDGDTATGSISVLIDDDSPTAVKAAGITSGLTNGGGDSASANLDGAVGGNSIVSDNFGADGGKVIFTNATVTALQGQNLKHDGSALAYAISPDGQTLTGYVEVGGGAGYQDGTDLPVFTIQLQTGGGGNDYTITMINSIDTLQNIDFNGGGYNFVGGNGSWAGFTSGDNSDQIIDLLLTPMVNGANASTMNTNANEGGVGSGNSVSLGEGVRVDTVQGLQATPAPTPSGDYSSLANQNHVFVDHENVVGISAVISTVNGPPGSTTNIQMVARDESVATDANDLVGDGNIEAITSVVITHGAFTATVLKINGLDQDVIVDGHTYNVVFGATDATVNDVIVGTRLGASTADGFDSLEFRNVGGQEFKIGDFNTLSISNGPLDMTVPITVIDGDGDTVSSGNLAIHIDGSAPPVVLDLDGDGVEFLGQDAGIAYDYGAGLVATAWAGADDGILVRDANHNGTVDGASEFVFGSNGTTDMEALHAQYGEQLDASDADFTMFAVWNDANSNGVVDGNEMQSLAEAGITSISLVSDGISYTTADGDVTVAGTASFTRADGTTGDAADAIFSTGFAAKAIQEVERVAANSNSVALAAAVGAVGIAASAPAAAEDFGFDGHFSAVTNMVVGREAFAGSETAYNSPAFEFGNAWDGGFHTSFQALSGTSFTAIAAGRVGELSSELSLGHGAPNALLEATDLAMMSMPMPAIPAVAMNVAMAPVDSLVAQPGAVGHEAAQLASIVQDALQGGGSAPDINALLNALPGAGLGGHAGLGGLASASGDAVSTWDMGHAGLFTAGGSMIITHEATMLHHDAVQPVANG